jgi:lysozyme family protein
MQDGFAITAPWLLGIEGFWSDNPNDRGGATKHGISLRFLRLLPDRDGDGYLDGDIDRDGDVDADDVRRLTLTEALKLYRSEFWDLCACDALPAGVDSAVLCAAVNHGPDAAAKLLQRALRVKADGDIGPVTLRAAARADVRELIPDYLSFRAQFYSDIVAGDSTQAGHLRGWFRRLMLLQQFIILERLA